jgi:hypothetical protein
LYCIILTEAHCSFCLVCVTRLHPNWCRWFRINGCLLNKSPKRTEKPKSYTFKNQHQYLNKHGNKTGSSNNHVICYTGNDDNVLASACVSNMWRLNTANPLTSKHISLTNLMYLNV